MCDFCNQIAVTTIVVKSSWLTVCHDCARIEQVRDTRGQRAAHAFSFRLVNPTEARANAQPAH